MRIKFWSLCRIAALSCLSASAAAQVQYRSGQIVYTPAIDFTLGYMANGTGYFVSQAYIPNPPQPTVNQPYYVSIRMEGIASPAVGRFMVVGFIPPTGTSVVVNVATPVRCFYRAMSGTGNFTEFTNQILTDVSFGANLRIFGCPQPAAGANPYSIIPVPGGNAYYLDRRDPAQPASTNWPLGSQAGYEFLIPVVSNRTMDGFSTNDRFYSVIRSIQGDGIDPWTNPPPHLALLVSPNSGNPVADMEAAPATPPAPFPSGKTGTEVTCRNLGPSTANNVSCGFNNIPIGRNATVNCNPISPQATLANGSSIRCAVIMDKFVGNATVEGVATSTTLDSNLANNTRSLTFSGGLTEVIYLGGFE
jgi:hypothetical protein